MEFRTCKAWNVNDIHDNITRQLYTLYAYFDKIHKTHQYKYNSNKYKRLGINMEFTWTVWAFEQTTPWHVIWSDTKLILYPISILKISRKGPVSKSRKVA